MNKAKNRPARRATEPNAGQPFRIPGPLEDLAGIHPRMKPIPETVYDRVMKRDERIFRRLAKV